MPDNPHFQQVPNAQAARRLLTFDPLLPRKIAGRRLQSMSVYLRDHRLRDVPEAERVLEADYEGFGFSQSRPGAEEARRRAFEVRYGRVFSTAEVAGYEARVYPLGPEPTPDEDDDD